MQIENQGRVLVSAEAFGVLGEYDHKFKLGPEDGFVILYGPNGVGKTRFLEIVNALTRLQGNVLASQPFASASLWFSDESSLSVIREERELDDIESTDISRYQIKFTLKRPGFGDLTWDHEDEEFLRFLRRHSRWAPVGDLYWQDQMDGEVLHVDDLRLHFENGPRKRTFKPAEQPDEAREYVANIHSFLIETQRLRAEVMRPRGGLEYSRQSGSTRRISRIEEQADTIRTHLAEAQTEHSRIAQRLDQTFPNRVLKAADLEQSAVTYNDDSALNPDAIRGRYAEQNRLRDRLAHVAPIQLAETPPLPDRRLQSWELILLNQYLDDASQKLAPFADLLDKLELLEEIINSRLLNKRIKISDDHGFTVQHQESGRAIQLDSLSSGEQHEVILMIDLLFNVPRDAVVLIDEPEISLHVAWQMAFIPDVERIAELSGFRFVVATHSPQIINDRWAAAHMLGPHSEAFE